MAVEGFEGWLSKMRALVGGGETLTESQKQHRTCLERKMESLSLDPLVVFMQKQLHLIGTKVYDNHIHCKPCSEERAGGFDPETGNITVCEDRIISQRHMNFTIGHELIHLFDHTFFNVDWTDLRHHACTEIRASSLSGDCKFRNEFAKGNLSKFAAQHQACVKRRAILSLLANETLKKQSGGDVEKAKQVAGAIVDSVFKGCFADTRPFDEIY